MNFSSFNASYDMDSDSLSVYGVKKDSSQVKLISILDAQCNNPRFECYGAIPESVFFPALEVARTSIKMLGL